MKRHLWVLGAAAVALAACKDQGDRASRIGSPARPASGDMNADRGPSSAAARSDNAQARDMRGTVVEAADDRVEVKVPGNPDVVLTVEPGTVVEVDGQAAKASQISEGAPVRATYLVAAYGALKALRVEVFSPPVK